MSREKLPKGWADTQLGSIIELKYGKSLAAQTRDGFGFPVYGSNGIVGKHSIPLINKSGLIVGRKGSYGVVNKSVRPFSPIDTTYYIDDFYNQPLEFLYYYLSFLPLNKLNRSTAIPGLNRDDAYNLNIALPPLAEQKIIAKKLDTLLVQVDSTKARLEQIPQILKRFRQSVLTRAVNGSLTEEWREFKKINSPISTPLKMLINSLDQGWSPKCENYSAMKHEWGVIKTSAVQSGVFINEANKKLPTSLTPKLNLSLKKDDILITRAGPRSRCGITCIVEKDYPFLMICDKVYRIRVNQEKIRSDFLNWCLNSPQYLELIEDIKTGSSDSGMNLTQKKFLSFTISVPHILEQQEIVRRVEQLFAYADTIEKQVNSALTHVNSLTQSILTKTFRGELTAQWRAENPDLISGENSATALLEKIKAERAASSSKKASRKKA